MKFGINQRVLGSKPVPTGRKAAVSGSKRESFKIKASQKCGAFFIYIQYASIGKKMNMFTNKEMGHKLIIRNYV